jgi:hypothetical protein
MILIFILYINKWRKHFLIFTKRNYISFFFFYSFARLLIALGTVISSSFLLKCFIPNSFLPINSSVQHPKSFFINRIDKITILIVVLEAAGWFVCLLKFANLTVNFIYSHFWWFHFYFCLLLFKIICFWWMILNELIDFLRVFILN